MQTKPKTCNSNNRNKQTTHSEVNAANDRTDKNNHLRRMEREVIMLTVGTTHTRRRRRIRKTLK
jgi:hypothetical protein